MLYVFVLYADKLTVVEPKLTGIELATLEVKGEFRTMVQAQTGEGSNSYICVLPN